MPSQQEATVDSDDAEEEEEEEEEEEDQEQEEDIDQEVMSLQQDNDVGDEIAADDERQEGAAGGGPQQQRVPAHIRDRQRAVAEREAARLARPEVRPIRVLGHADRTKSAVTSTPSGVVGGGVGAVFALSLSSSSSLAVVSQEWCGPFSVARQLIAQREEAKRKRLREEAEMAAAAAHQHPLDQAVALIEVERLRRAHPSLQWKPQKASEEAPAEWDMMSGFAKRQKRAERMLIGNAVPSLMELCLDYLVENFEHVESLGDATVMDDTIRSSIAKALISKGKMNEASFQAIAEAGMETLEVIDCSQISEEVLTKTLQKLLPAGLRCIVLDQVGRCFGSSAVKAIVSSTTASDTNPKPAEIAALSLGGAYLLTDDQASDLLRAVSKTITSLEFKACPLLGVNFCRTITEALAPHGTLLELALEDIPLTDLMLQSLSAQPAALRRLRNLRLCRLEGLSDEAVAHLLTIAGDSLEALDLTCNFNLTDATLGAIRQYCSSGVGYNNGINGNGINNEANHARQRLQSLTLSGLRHITATGLEALFMTVPGMAEPPRLRRLDVSHCDHEAVTDEVIDWATRASTQRRVTGDGLVFLNVQGSCRVTDRALECVAATCANTLQELNVSFCSSITASGLGYLVDTVGKQLSKLHVWGNAQVTDEFLDGNQRAQDPTLEICGMWMKKFRAEGSSSGTKWS